VFITRKEREIPRNSPLGNRSLVRNYRTSPQKRRTSKSKMRETARNCSLFVMLLWRSSFSSPLSYSRTSRPLAYNHRVSLMFCCIWQFRSNWLHQSLHIRWTITSLYTNIDIKLYVMPISEKSTLGSSNGPLLCSRNEIAYFEIIKQDHKSIRSNVM